VRIIQLPAPHHPRGEILHQHVADPDQVPQDLTPLVPAQVKRERLLAAVQQVERASAVPRIVAGFVVRIHPGKCPAARDIQSPRPFDLDDLGAKIRQHAAGIGQREHVADIDDPQSGQGKRRLRVLLFNPHRLPLPQMMPRSRNRPISASEYPNPANTSALCWPSSGEDRRHDAAPALMFHMRKGTRILPIN